MQVRIGNVVEMDGKLVQVIKSVHGAGQGRQLGNVQVSSHADSKSIASILYS